MRMYRRVSNDESKAVYEYLWNSYKKTYTGLVEINKKDLSYKVLKLADGDPSEERAGFYAMRALSNNNYPESYTHTAT